MSDKLEQFVAENREAFDSLPTPDMYTSIEANVNATPDASALWNVIKSWKLFSLIVVVAGGSLVMMNLNSPNEPQAQQVLPILAPTEEVEQMEEAKAPEVEVVVVGEDTFEVLQAPVAPPLPKSVQEVIESIPDVIIDEDFDEDEAYVEEELKLTPNVTTTDVAPEDYVADEQSSKKQPKETVAEGLSLNETYRAVENVVIDGLFCDVKFVHSNTGEMKVTGKLAIESKGVEYKFKCKKSRNTLVVKLERDNKKRNCSMKVDEAWLEISLPPYVDKLDITTLSGDISGSGYEGEKMSLKSTSGNISASNILSKMNLTSFSGDISMTTAEGQIKGKTTSGSQEYKHVIGDVDLKSFSGDVTVKDVDGDAIIGTTSGSQEIDKMNGDLETKSFSGDVTVKDIEGRAITVEVTSGTIQLKHAVAEMNLVSFSGDVDLANCEGQINAKSTSGSIEGASIRVAQKATFKTFSGDVKMDFKNMGDDMSFDLSGSSGTLKISMDQIKVRGKKSLIAGEGPIKVIGKSSSGSQSYF